MEPALAQLAEETTIYLRPRPTFETIEREQFIQLLDGKAEEDVFGPDEPVYPSPPPEPPPERERKPAPSMGLAYCIFGGSEGQFSAKWGIWPPHRPRVPDKI